MREKTNNFGLRPGKNTNQPIESQKIARSFKFRMKEEERLYYPCSENKGVICFAVTVKLICVFVFAYEDCWFPCAEAQMEEI